MSKAKHATHLEELDDAQDTLVDTLDRLKQVGDHLAFVQCFVQKQLEHADVLRVEIRTPALRGLDVTLTALILAIDEAIAGIEGSFRRARQSVTGGAQ